MPGQQPAKSSGGGGGKACLIIVVLILLLGLGTCGACVAGGYWMYSHFKDMALVPIELVNQVQAGDSAGAYQHMSAAYQAKASADELAAFFADQQLRGELALVNFNDNTRNGVRTIAVAGSIGNKPITFYLVPDGETFKVDRIESAGVETPGYAGQSLSVPESLPSDALAVVRENDLAQVTITLRTRGAKTDDQGSADLALGLRVLSAEGQELIVKKELTRYQGAPPKGDLTWTISLDPRPERAYDGVRLEVTITDKVAGESVTREYPLVLPAR